MSIANMRPTAKRALRVVGLFVAAAAIFLASALYSLNRQRQRVAAEMMHDAGRLKVGADVSEVLAFATRYDATLSAESHGKPCTSSDCLIVAGVPSDKSMLRHPKINEVSEAIFRRAWIYVVFMWVKDGKLAGQQQWFTYMTPDRDLAVVTRTSPASASQCRYPSYVLHSAYSVDMAPHHFNVWADPNAEEKDSVLQLGLRCVNSLLGCRAFSEMAPEAWQRYERDERVLETESESVIRGASTSCTAAFNAH